jgi:tripartite-type tricarboxylate transporter receptor subunit TctC
MNALIRKGLSRLLIAASALGLSPAALAQQFPAKNVLIVVPTAPGGPLDVLSRLIQPRLSSLIGQPVIVDNKPGAATYIGNDFVVKSAPDGYTLLAQGFSGMHSHLFVKGHAVLSKELVPVALLAESENVFISSATIPPRTLKEFFDYAKGNPGKLNLAAFLNTQIYLQTITFLQQNGVTLVDIPYNGSASIYPALARGDAHFYMATIGGAKAAIDAGQVRALAVPSPRRSQLLPNVPTNREAGYDFDASGIFAILAPARTPTPVVRYLNEKIQAAIDVPETRDRLEKLGYTYRVATPEALTAQLASDAVMMERAARAARIQPE